MEIISAFAGMGGFDLAFERAGAKVVCQIENDRNCRKVLHKHWPDVLLLGDIKEVDPAELPDADVFCGGFPCQDVSLAGRRAGLAGERTGLFWEFVRLVAAKRPRWLVIENVPGLLSSNGGRDMGAILRTLGELGYWWAYRSLDAEYFGLAQRRERVFIVCCLGDGTAAAKVLFEPESCDGDSPPRRETGAELARDVAASLRGSGGQPRGWPCDAEVGLVAHALTASKTAAGRLDPNGETFVTQSLTQTFGKGGADDNLAQGGFLVAHTLRAEGFDASEDGTGRGVPLVLHENIGGNLAAADYARALRSGASHSYQMVVGGAEDGNAEETRPREILRILREKAGAEALEQWGLGVLTALYEAQVLRPGVHGSGLRPATAHPEPGSEDITPLRERGGSDGAVCDMWRTECVRRASQEWGLVGQQPRELAAYLQELSQQSPSQIQALRDLWQASEGLGLLREALSAVQEIWRPVVDQAQPTHALAAVRRLTPTETLRLQGFPDDWLDGLGLADGPKYRMAGNGVAVPCARWIAERLTAVDENSADALADAGLSG